MHLQTDCMAQTRWAFNVSAWDPSEDEWNRALRMIEAEEQTRVLRFLHRIDAKRALIGRLLMRRFVQLRSNLAWNSIRLLRTSAGKPYWQPPTTSASSSAEARADFDPDAAGALKFNISHHGDFVLLASAERLLIGCDVMTLEVPGRDKDVGRFFDDMASCFTPNEWALIRARSTDGERLRQFFTLWALKESFIKAVGIGLGFDLQANTPTVIARALIVCVAALRVQLCRRESERGDRHDDNARAAAARG